MPRTSPAQYIRSIPDPCKRIFQHICSQGTWSPPAMQAAVRCPDSTGTACTQGRTSRSRSPSPLRDQDEEENRRKDMRIQGSKRQNTEPQYDRKVYLSMEPSFFVRAQVNSHAITHATCTSATALYYYAITTTITTILLLLLHRCNSTTARATENLPARLISLVKDCNRGSCHVHLESGGLVDFGKGHNLAFENRVGDLHTRIYASGYDSSASRYA